MNRLILIPACLSGCFYTDPINQRPSLDIHQVDPGSAVYRNTTLGFSTIPMDPDGDSVAVTWRAYACTGIDCDPVEFDSGADTTFTVLTPKVRTTGGVFDTLHIVLEARDVHGATAKPVQTLDLNVIDAPPTLALRKEARNTYVVGTDIGLYAKVGDADDGYAALDPLTWVVHGPPTMATYTLTELAIAQDSADLAHHQFGKTFRPAGLGDWNIEVTATDPSGVMASQELPVSVVADHPPCLAQWDPTATPMAGTTLPMTDPTLFQVLVVADDLDPFPSTPSTLYGTAEFHWSIVPPSGTRQSLTGVTGSGVALDPDSYTPGDIVELRVEIQDRNHTAVNCPATDLTCSVISDQGCLQRLSWSVEVR